MSRRGRSPLVAFMHFRMPRRATYERFPRQLVCGDGRGPWLCQAGAVRGDAPLGGLGEVLPQVEPVGDLDRVPGAAAGGV